MLMPLLLQAAAVTAPAPGEYVCTYDYWSGAYPNRVRQSDQKGTLTLLPGGRYRWLSNGGGGRYAYVPASRTIRFVDGPMAAKRPLSAEYTLDRRTSQIDIDFGDDLEWSCGHNL